MQNNRYFDYACVDQWWVVTFTEKQAEMMAPTPILLPGCKSVIFKTECRDVSAKDLRALNF